MDLNHKMYVGSGPGVSLLHVLYLKLISPTFLPAPSLPRSAKREVHGLVKFVPAVACWFCLTLPGQCLVESAHLLADLCTWVDNKGG